MLQSVAQNLVARWTAKRSHAAISVPRRGAAGGVGTRHLGEDAATGAMLKALQARGRFHGRNATDMKALTSTRQNGVIYMRKIIAVVLAASVTLIAAQPAFADDPAAGSIRASAERLAAEAELEQPPERRRSGARVGLGVALVAAGVGMLLIEPQQPTQPTQPGTVSTEDLQDAAFQYIPLDHLFVRQGRGVVLPCEPRCPGDIDEAIGSAYLTGIAYGLGTTTLAIEYESWTLYQEPLRPFVPYKERSAGLKYGGAALAVAGVLIAGLWSTVPMSNSLNFGVSPDGLQVGKTFGF